MARICIDLDGVISRLKSKGQTYSDLEVMPGAIEKISALRQNGHYIIIQTARHMKTCDGNVGKVIQRIGKQTIDWLDKNGIEYDELYFGKPWANVYIDDNGFRFTDWDEFNADGSNLPVSNELLHEKNT